MGRAVIAIPPGERGQQIADGLRADAPPAFALSFAVQEQATGTADAVLAAQPHFDAAEALVVNGDLGLLSEAQLRPLLDAPRTTALLATARLDDPAKMGRILRDPADRRALGIVEHRDATPEQRKIKEVNVGVYRFDAAWLWGALTPRAAARVGRALRDRRDQGSGRSTRAGGGRNRPARRTAEHRDTAGPNRRGTHRAAARPWSG